MWSFLPTRPVWRQPSSDSAFYPTILGAVLLGIGLALFVDARRGTDGLGVRGAIAINLLGGGLLLAWLVLGNVEIPVHGTILL